MVFSIRDFQRSIVEKIRFLNLNNFVLNERFAKHNGQKINVLYNVSQKRLKTLSIYEANLDLYCLFIQDLRPD